MVLKKNKDLIEKVVKKIFRFYLGFIMVGWIMGNFMAFLVFGMAWANGGSDLIKLLMFIMGGNIVMFVLEFDKMVKRNKGGRDD